VNELELFAAAVAATDPAERAALLDRECAGDPAKWARLEALLRANDLPDSLLDQPIVSPPPEAGHGPTREIPMNPEIAETRTYGHEEDAMPANDEVPLGFLEPATRSDSLGRIGHYEVLQVLGQGGFGIVFRAFDEVLHRVVAVKVLSPQLAATSPARKRFLREARSSAQVRHENVVQVYEVGEQPLPYIVMEFIPGETLQQRLDRIGPIEPAEVVRIGRQIAEGLAAAHATDLIHRDIKPGNVLLEAGAQRVKITDFGLARAADDASISQSGIIAGTPMYMAPEQAKGETLDQRADLFSLGSVLYVMASGRAPFRATGTLAVLKRVAEDTPRPIREIIPETPQWLCDIIAKLHAKNPEERFQSAREVADVLADCEAQLKANAKLKDFSRIPKEKPGVRRSRRRRTLVAVGLLVLAAGLTFGGLFAHSRGWENSYHYLANESLVHVSVSDPVEEIVISKDGQALERIGGGLAIRTLSPGQYQFQVVTRSGFAPTSLVAEVSGYGPGGTMSSLPDNGQFSLILNRGTEVHVSVRSAETLKPSSADRGFVSLFNSKDLAGWQTHLAPEGSWAVENGVLVGRGGHHYLFTRRDDYENFQLRVEARINAGGNSGVFFRCQPAPEAQQGYEAEIDGTGEERPTGSLWRYPIRPWLLKAAPTPAVPAGEWFRLEVSAVGNRITIQVNGIVTADVTDDTHARGHLALQVFQDRMRVEFRKIEIKELPPTPAPADGEFIPIFNGKDLAAWQQPYGGEWKVADGVLRGAAKSGEYAVLPTLREYANFELRAELRLTGSGNGGILCRSENGYQVEVHPEYTGSIARSKPFAWLERKKHSLVEPGAWFQLDVVADGPRLTSKVNGKVVASVTDRGLARGYIGIEVDGRDTGAAVVECRKLEVKELPPSPSAAPLKYGDPEYTNSLGMKFKLIPAGKFMMGSSQKEIDRCLKQFGDDTFEKKMLPTEAPEHPVEITRPFYLGATEITVGQFRQFVDEQGYQVGDGRWRNPGFDQTDQHPVVFVSWNNAVDFCKWLSKKEGKEYRLPTEAEWEYSCRAGKAGSRYGFGDDNAELENYAWYFKNSGGGTHPVGQKKPNAWGLYDMHGNAGELCQDNFDPDYYKNSPVKDPPGGAGDARPGRGGSWTFGAAWCRTAFRGFVKPGEHHPAGGFRVLLVSPPAGVGTENGAKDKPAPTASAPFTDAEVQRIAALPADQQVEEVRKELVRRNPGFDGRLERKIEDGVVTEFKIVTDHVTDIAPIRVFKALRVLNCSGTWTGGPNGLLADLTPLKGMNLAGLTHLGLRDTKVTDAGMVCFKDCKALTHLGLNLTNVTDAGLVHFQHCKALTALSLLGTKVSDAGLANFKNCKNLTELCLSYTQIGDAGLVPFQDCKNLTILDLSNTRVSDAGLSYFKDCKDLRELYLWNTKLTDAGLIHFKDCKGLTHLALNGTSVNDAGLVQFKGMPLRKLWIGNTAITDLTSLQGMPLEVIYLTPKNITKGLDILRDVKSLKTIGISRDQSWPVAEFWQRYDKGEFTK
jgi:formylglycine-generating enzyme required for sulfatase activity/serine/threonine protein kinase